MDIFNENQYNRLRGFSTKNFIVNDNNWEKLPTELRGTVVDLVNFIKSKSEDIYEKHWKESGFDGIKLYALALNKSSMFHFMEKAYNLGLPELSDYRDSLLYDKKNMKGFLNFEELKMSEYQKGYSKFVQRRLEQVEAEDVLRKMNRKKL